MKKHLRLSMLTLLCAVVGYAWADSYTYEFTSNLISGNTTNQTTLSQTTFDLNGWDWKVEITKRSDVTSTLYYFNYNETYGWLIGHSTTKNYRVTKAILKTVSSINNVKKVKVVASSENPSGCNISVNVGGEPFGGNAQNLSSSNQEFTFESTTGAEGVVSIILNETNDTQKILRIKKIEITYGEIIDPPTFSVPDGSTVDEGSSVTITPAEGCGVSYTVNNGDEIITDGAASVTINETSTIKAKSVKEGSRYSEEAVATYYLAPIAPPTFSLPDGSTIDEGSSVTITPAEGCGVSYTVNDGEEIVTDGAASVTINEPSTIKAKSVKNGSRYSEEAVATYKMNKIIPMPIGDNIIDFEQDLTKYLDWNFNNIYLASAAASQMDAHGGNYYGEVETGNAELTSIQTALPVGNPTKMSFYYTLSIDPINSMTDVVCIQISSDGSNWTNLATSEKFKYLYKGNWVKLEADLRLYKNVYVRLYVKKVTNYIYGLCLDDIKLECSDVIDIAEPVFSLENGAKVEKNTVLTITSETGKVAYTTDANKSMPDIYESTPLNITLDKGMTIKAAAVSEDNKHFSKLVEATYSVLGQITFNNTFDFSLNCDYGTGLIQSKDHITSGPTWTSGDVSLTMTGDFVWYNNKLSSEGQYGPNFMISVPDEYVITEISMTGNNLNGWYVMGESASEAPYTTLTWSGEAKSVFCYSELDTDIRTITVTFKKSVETIPITADYGTYCSAYNLKFNSGAYVVAGIKNKDTGIVVSLIKVTEVPAGTGIVIKKTSDATEVKPTILESSNAYHSNMLIGVLQPTEISQIDNDNTNFVLSKRNDVIGFYKAPNKGATIPANRAYLPIPTSLVSASADNLKLVFEDETDSINLTPTSPMGEENSYYSIDGRRINGQPVQKGVYILNGKKILVK